MKTAVCRAASFVAIVALCVVSAGCSSLQIMENRIACSTDLAELFFVSRYGTIGISADVSAKDAKRTCEALLLRQMLERQGGANGAASKTGAT